MSDSAEAIGERIRLAANDVPTQTIREVARWLDDLKAKIINELGPGHPLVGTVAAMIDSRNADVDQLIASFSQLMAEIEELGDRIAGH